MKQKNKCLITGCEGFIGSHLADLLISKRMRVYGMVYADIENIAHLKDKIKIFRCDLKNKKKVNEIINKVRPDYVFHLGAQSFATVGWEEPEETLKVNVLGTFYLLDSIRRAKINPVIEIIESATVYGLHSKNDFPLTEDSELRPTNLYGVSKVCDGTLGYFYHQAYGMRIIRVRPFNITGPRKIKDACADFSKGIIDIEKGLKEKLGVGNLDTIRDYVDGRDAVKALWLLAKKGRAGEIYNISSGKCTRIKDILKKLILFSGRNIKMYQDPKKLRITDDPIVIGDNSKLRRLGWKPKIPIEKTLNDILDYWRNKIK